MFLSSIEKLTREQSKGEIGTNIAVAEYQQVWWNLLRPQQFIIRPKPL